MVGDVRLASSARRWENRFAAASTRSPRGERLSTRAAFSSAVGQPCAEREQRFAHSHAPGFEPQRRARRVVRGEHAGRERRVVLARASGNVRAPSSQHALDRVTRQSAGTQQHRLTEARDDRGLDPDRRRAAVDDEVDAAAEIGKHVRGGGRRHVAGTVGRGRDNRIAQCRENIARDRMVGDAHRDAVEAGGGELGDRTAGRLGQNKRQRARPERRCKTRASTSNTSACFGGRNIGDMGDQRIERRPALGVIEAGDGLPVGRVGAEAVDRLGRERDETARRQHARRIRDGRGICSLRRAW